MEVKRTCKHMLTFTKLSIFYVVMINSLQMEMQSACSPPTGYSWVQMLQSEKNYVAKAVVCRKDYEYE